MKYQRLHLRIPLIGDAILSNDKNVKVMAHTVDVSQAGVGITAPSSPLENTEYQIEVNIHDRGSIRPTASLIHHSKLSAGFKTTYISAEDLQIIRDLIAEFQTSEDFITYIEEHNILDDWLGDTDGTEFDITFEAASKANCAS
jgi:hypothetical protein